MAKQAALAPIARNVQPKDQTELATVVREASHAREAIYPLGGGTSQGFGLPARQEGIGLSLAGLQGVVDYPARDMTITLEAGITMAQLASRLAEHGQRLPIDVPQAERATLGGVIATNVSGPRRFAHGTIRDYVIGIRAVDGRGMIFNGGGRVVKNVAGYDFCKLLCGSLGTLGVIVQATLKLKPVPQATALLAASVSDVYDADRLLAALIDSQTTPTAIELLSGPAWCDDPALSGLTAQGKPALLVGMEGTRTEIDWMLGRLRTEWQELGVGRIHQPTPDQTETLWQRLIEFPAADPTAVVLKINVVPSAVCGILDLLTQIDPQCSVQAHAGNGIVLARMSESAGLSQALVQKLQPAARRASGNAIVYSAAEGMEATRQTIWGSSPDELRVMQDVKRQFDPYNLLNPGRFVYGAS